jgi:pimeloyl-ACP methyl ester carboxylesterase
MRIGQYGLMLRSDRHDGLAYTLAEPEGEPRGGVVILHGASSCKENHLDFARACTAAGLAAIAFDQRSHGASEGVLGGGVLDDVAAIAALLPGDGPVFLRGTSMGGCLAIAAAQRAGARAVVAICPPSPGMLLAGLRAGRLELPSDTPALAALLEAIDLEQDARALGPDLMLLHAEGDEVVPVAYAARLHEVAAGSRFVRVAGGHHRSIQHDAALQAQAIAFLLARCAAP